MATVPVGAKGTFELIVRPEHLANQFKDATLPPVLSTPVLVMIMENAALNAVRAYLDPGESAVGIRVEVEHLAPTPAGRRVVGEAEVTAVDGKRMTLAIRAWDDAGEVGRGVHERVRVDVAKFAARMQVRHPSDG